MAKYLWANNFLSRVLRLDYNCGKGSEAIQPTGSGQQG
jgi:hypothetical protein